MPYSKPQSTLPGPPFRVAAPCALPPYGGVTENTSSSRHAERNPTPGMSRARKRERSGRCRASVSMPWLGQVPLRFGQQITPTFQALTEIRGIGLDNPYRKQDTPFNCCHGFGAYGAQLAL